MRKFVLYIELENSAFENNPGEVARILEDQARRIRENNRFEIRKLRDVNGNAVGEVYVTK